MEVGGEPEGYSNITCQRARNTIGPVDSARKGVLVRQVPSTEETDESAAKKRQRERSHLSKERDECAIRATVTKAGLKWSRRLYDSSLKNSCGIHRQD